VAQLKYDAQEIALLREEIRVVIARVAKYLSHPLALRIETVESVALK
jgi:hypothetical protein